MRDGEVEDLQAVETRGQERLEGRRNLEEGDTYVAGKTWSLERLGGRRDLETGAT